MTEFLEALRSLSSYQKTAKGVPAYTRYVNRPVGRVFAAAANSLSLRPNQVTVVSGTLTTAGIGLVASIEPTPLIGVAVGLLLMFGFFLDSADGQLARLQGSGSSSGEWLDHVVDCGKFVLLHTAVLVSWYRFSELPSAMLLIPLGYQLVAVLIFFGGVLADKLGSHSKASSYHVARAVRSRAVAMLPVDYGVLCIAFLFHGFQSAFAVIYAALFVANALFFAAFAVKWFRQLSATVTE